MSNLVRRYKIHQIEPCLTKRELLFIEYLKKLLNNLKKFNLNKYTFYLDINNRVVFEYYEEEKILLLSQYFLGMMNGLFGYVFLGKNYDILKYLTESRLNIKIVNFYHMYNDYKNIENEYLKMNNEQSSQKI